MPTVEIDRAGKDWGLAALRCSLRQADGRRTQVHLFSDDIGENTIQIDLSIVEAAQLIGALGRLLRQAADQ